MDAVELPAGALKDFLASTAFAEMLDPEAERSATRTPTARKGELSDVLRALDDYAGQRFVGRERAGEVIFGGLAGGGFGVRPSVVDAVLDMLRPVAVPAPGAPKPVPAEARSALGVYVYALVDPRDATVFYVGTGRGNRVYHHTGAALAGVAVDPSDIIGGIEPESVSAATEERIRDIDADGFGVEHWILHHDIDTLESAGAVALFVEQVAVDLATVARLGLTNSPAGDSAGTQRFWRAEELVLRFAAPVAPPLPEPCALVKVDAAARADATAEQIYEWARSAWRAGPHRTVPDLPVLVFADDIIRAVHRVHYWEAYSDAEGNLDPKRWVYTGVPDPDLETRYVGTSLREVRDQRGGKWNAHGWHPYGQV
ncbi:GIY-YIG nuclease family protein [Gordonia sp. zg691]|uniref:GIY-YIG nuclease family protein n=1 Tax=Gordonia jinghuaiqii TaxID=2758710 RepID=A0A7D7R140_9ACTN|nr:GIY-YIG nuclease family protein [Gordonia jinghuaiqii]MBD0863501.1 GIY-YIG nuclease family protein [Gordonia jinghuaiqii]MCR5979236.1 GIY-YIG nuclease family protein [Gordonia jinghuaiqii]QMT04029.1 GIY-YIG nuclease family protein [Gordonia jinghuaiqii]